MPTQEQFDAFGKIHIQCQKTPSDIYPPENDVIIFIINGGLPKEELLNNIHLFVSKD